MQNMPNSVAVTIAFIALNAVFWLAYAIIIAFGSSALTTIPAIMKWGFIVLAVGCSLLLAGIALFLGRRKRPAFYFGLLMLTLVAVLSIADQFGWLDLFSLLISLIPLVLLLKDRDWYLRRRQG